MPIATESSSTDRPLADVALPRSLRCTTSRLSQERSMRSSFFDLCQSCIWIFMRYCKLLPVVPS
jgi:hypothetical protein